MKTTRTSISRRDVMKGATGLGLAASAMIGTSELAKAQAASDVGSHPLVGTWLATFEETPEVEGHLVFHDDGVLINVFPLDAATFFTGAVPGAWEPVSDMSGTATMVMIGTEQLLQSPKEVFRTIYRLEVTVDEGGDTFSGWYEYERDEVVNGPMTLTGIRVQPERMISELPEATPES